MSIQDLSLPSSMLTTSQYEDRQAKALFDKQENLDRDDFLLLFTTQLKNQNPLDPLENEAFVAQLAQFSSLESMKGMQQTMDDMANESKSDKFLLGANLLGKTVTVEGGQVLAGGGRDLSLSGLVDSPLTDAIFRVYDSQTGGLIHQREISKLDAGEVELDWNGQDSDGQPFPESTYQFSLIANKGDEKIVVPLVSQQVINSVNWDADTQKLKIKLDGGDEMPLDKLSTIQI